MVASACMFLDLRLKDVYSNSLMHMCSTACVVDGSLTHDGI